VGNTVISVSHTHCFGARLSMVPARMDSSTF
jgi:hypothetical protein